MELVSTSLTNEQLALIIAEKVTGTISHGAKRDEEVMSSANKFLKWLQENKSK